MSDFAFQKEDSASPQQEIEKLEAEIAEMYRKRGIFLGIGLPLLIVGFVAAVACSVAGQQVLMYLFSNVAAGGVALLILRSALFNTRIKNRKNRILQLKNQALNKD